MAEFVAEVTARGQLTVPVAVRRKLGIKPGDRVAFVIDAEGGARMRRIEPDFRPLQGMIPTPPGLATADLDALIEEAMSAHADWVVQRMRDGLE